MHVGVGTVQRTDAAIRHITEHVGREQWRREQHQREQTGDTEQHRPRGELVRGPDRHRVGDEHQAQHRDQATESEVENAASEHARQPNRHRSHRLRQQHVRPRRRERDQHPARHHAGQAKPPQSRRQPRVSARLALGRPEIERAAARRGIERLGDGRLRDHACLTVTSQWRSQTGVGPLTITPKIALAAGGANPILWSRVGLVSTRATRRE